ncbi:MAG TPA: U32 family peptidase [Chloroflexota bacterium]|nr:U32 family peptidase [Chloroflexota bacterium]
MASTRPFLSSLGLPPGDLYDLPSSGKRFPDGAQYRIEIPSTEGPRCLEAVLEEAVRRDVPVHRVSQGSGVGLLTAAELDETARMAADARVEVSLFARPNASWQTSAMARSDAGAVLAPAAWGQEGVVAALDEVRRAADHGIRSVLIADIGVLSVFGSLRAAGELPADMQAKVSVMMTVSNPATARLVAQLGANTINVPSDLTLPQLAAIRAVIDLPIDIYIESPDNLGGFLRYPEMVEIIRVCAPVYLKFGLRNAPDVYPSGTHLEGAVVALSRERVRRAEIALEMLQAAEPQLQTSEIGAAGLALPQPARALAT